MSAAPVRPPAKVAVLCRPKWQGHPLSAHGRRPTAAKQGVTAARAPVPPRRISAARCMRGACARRATRGHPTVFSVCGKEDGAARACTCYRSRPGGVGHPRLGAGQWEQRDAARAGSPAARGAAATRWAPPETLPCPLPRPARHRTSRAQGLSACFPLLSPWRGRAPHAPTRRPPTYRGAAAAVSGTGAPPPADGCRRCRPSPPAAPPAAPPWRPPRRGGSEDQGGGPPVRAPRAPWHRRGAASPAAVGWAADAAAGGTRARARAVAPAASSRVTPRPGAGGCRAGG